VLDLKTVISAAGVEEVVVDGEELEDFDFVEV
jgi:hypothetical protein